MYLTIIFRETATLLGVLGQISRQMDQVIRTSLDLAQEPVILRLLGHLAQQEYEQITGVHLGKARGDLAEKACQQIDHERLIWSNIDHRFQDRRVCFQFSSLVLNYPLEHMDHQGDPRASMLPIGTIGNTLGNPAIHRLDLTPSRECLCFD
jgi:hypothetical protein